MKQYNRLPKILTLSIGIGLFLASLIIFLWLGWPEKTKGPIVYGVTFSQPYAEELGLNWRELLTAALDDLGIKRFRLPAYWSLVEPKRGQFDWNSLDYQMGEIARRNGKVLLAIGLKLPRWPECWMPDWTRSLNRQDEQAARLEYLRATALRYKDHPALLAWQVENEADFPFGRCPAPDRSFLRREIAFVRALDSGHPIVTTDSGELSSWLLVSRGADALGISVYRVVTTPWKSVWRYTWIPPFWYVRHALLVSPWVKRVFISEFQMEPWTNNGFLQTPLTEQFKTFNIDRMRANLAFAERMQFDEIYFWGVEWWWWVKTEQGDARFWDAAKEFISP